MDFPRKKWRVDFESQHASPPFSNNLSTRPCRIIDRCRALRHAKLFCSHAKVVFEDCTESETTLNYQAIRDGYTATFINLRSVGRKKGNTTDFLHSPSTGHDLTIVISTRMYIYAHTRTQNRREWREWRERNIRSRQGKKPKKKKRDQGKNRKERKAMWRQPPGHRIN